MTIQNKLKQKGELKMTNFYLDIETTGLNPRKDKIITIQYQELDRSTGEPIFRIKNFKRMGIF